MQESIAETPTAKAHDRELATDPLQIPVLNLPVPAASKFVR
jgi:hypothetical protein